MLRRKGSAPLTSYDVLVERLNAVEQEVKQLRQAGPTFIQADDHEDAYDPFPWQSLIHWPGGHRDAWPTDNHVYYHPGRIDPVSGETISAGYKAVSGPVCKPFKLFRDDEVNDATEFVFMIPEDLNRTKLLRPAAFVSTPSGTSISITVFNMLRANRAMLTRAIAIDAGDYTSYQATLQPIVNNTPVTDDPFSKVYTGDLIKIVAAASGGTGLGVYLYFQ